MKQHDTMGKDDVSETLPGRGYRISRRTFLVKSLAVTAAASLLGGPFPAPAADALDTGVSSQ